MTSPDVFKVLETMISQLEPTQAESNLISQMLDTIKAWEMACGYYSKGHYDKGVLARQALSAMSDKDFAHLRRMVQFNHVQANPYGQEN